MKFWTSELQSYFSKLITGLLLAEFSSGDCHWTSLSDEKWTFIQVMAWCHQATSHYLSQCWPRSVLPNAITRPQRVKSRSMVCHSRDEASQIQTISNAYYLWWWTLEQLIWPDHWVQMGVRLLMHIYVTQPQWVYQVSFTDCLWTVPSH